MSTSNDPNERQKKIAADNFHFLVQKRLALQTARHKATDDSWGFWKDPRTIFGVILTCVFSAGWAVVSWNLRDSAHEAGRRSVYEPACVASCERRNSTMEILRETQGVYTCFCEDGAHLIPIQGRLFTTFSTP